MNKEKDGGLQIVRRNGNGLKNARGSALAPGDFAKLGKLPPEMEWLGNIASPHTRRAYRSDIGEFLRFCGADSSEKLREIQRPHIIAWRKDLEKRELSGATIRRKLAALSSLFDHLCEAQVVSGNPADGVKRPNSAGAEGKTPALSDAQMRALLDAPSPDTLKGKRDRAILATLAYHGLRRSELCRLSVGDVLMRSGSLHLRIEGKGDKLRWVVAHPKALRLIEEYLEAAGHADEPESPLFRPVRNRTGGGKLTRALNPNSIYRCIVLHHAKAAGVHFRGLRPHSLRASAATNALEHNAGIEKVQEWLGHADISTTRLYDKRNSKPEDSPTLRVDF